MHVSGGVYDQHKSISAKDKIFVPGTRVRQYWPRDSEGRRIKSVAPGTMSGPRWCPAGLTHTQKRRVQRLRALEIREEIAEKKRDGYFNRETWMVTTKNWKEKRIMAEDIEAENVTADDPTDDMINDENSETSKDVATDMDVDMVFVLPTEFCASEA